jgi:Peptidase M50B-like
MRDAFHEAGHAVMAWSLGVEVKGLQLLTPSATERRRGTTGTGSVEHLSAREQIAICKAGLVGGDLSGLPMAADEAQDDLAKEVDLLSRTYRDDTLRYETARNEAYNLADTTLKRHADLCAKIARALEAQGELSESEFEALLGDDPRPDRV